MIKVNTIEDFQKFIVIAKDKNIEHIIFGKKHEFIQKDSQAKTNKHIWFEFYLTCSMFDVFISGKIKGDIEVENLKNNIANFDFVQVQSLQLKDGLIEIGY